MKTKSSSGLKVKSAIKACGMPLCNHSRSGLKVKTGINAAGMPLCNHVRSGLRVKTDLKAGASIDLKPNHNRRLLAVG